MEAHRRYIKTLIQVKTTFYSKNCKVFNMTTVMTRVKEKRKRESSEMKQGQCLIPFAEVLLCGKPSIKYTYCQDGTESPLKELNKSI